MSRFARSAVWVVLIAVIVALLLWKTRIYG
jgi:hypothetical protein